MKEPQAKKNNNNNGAEQMNWNAMQNQFMDFNKVRSVVARNMEAMVAANQAALDGAKAMAERTYRAVQDNAQHGVESLKQVCGNKNPQDAQRESAAAVTKAVQSFTKNAEEVAQIYSRSATEVLGIFSEVFNRNLHELNGGCCKEEK
jgi:hypothetical protein